MTPDPHNRHALDWLAALAGLLALVLIVLLGGCKRPEAAQPAVAVEQAIGDAQAEVADVIEDPVDDASRNITVATTGAVVAVQSVVQELLPEPPPAATPSMPAAAVRMIVKSEVISPGYYRKRLTHPIWPGGKSGATCCIGYDAGMQTAATIRADFADHPGVDRWATAAGTTGFGAKAVAAGLRDLTFTYEYASDLFTRSTLPRFHAAARRALGDGFDLLPEDAQGALDSLGYNRGWLMIGPNRSEMREIRDICIPAGDVHCIAAQLRSMKRIWPTNKSPHPGLRARREDEARTAEGAA